MKLTYAWLRDYLEGDFVLEDVLEGLVNIGLEVEDVTHEAERLKDFILAEISAVRPHPEADRLQICTVNTGQKTLELVCGGKNARAGIKVVLAQVGVVIPSTGQVLKAGKVRGIDSPGMLCSSDELLIDVPCEGILELETDLPLGSPIVSALGLDDPVIDIAITPNRADCFSVYGIARDLYAYFKTKNKNVTLKAFKAPKVKTQFNHTFHVTNHAPDVFYQFGLTLIKGVTNGQSPQNIKSRMKAVGLRSLSALVDVTNYVCLDLGGPLHVFDADKVMGTITLRLSKEGETFEGLDDKTYTLSEGMPVICDEEGIISLAGIMGGKRTGCDNETRNVLLESAWFDPITIAKTGQKLAILSDARTRFERGVDPLMVEEGMAQALCMIQNQCGGEISQTHWVKDKISYTPHRITLTLEKIVRVTGETFFIERIGHMLRFLGCAIESQDMDQLTVTVPSWRHDLSEDIDLIEEIVRLRGVDVIQEVSLPVKHMTMPVPSAHASKVCRQALVNLGYIETINFSFIDAKTAASFCDSTDADTLIHLKNPITTELTTMRPSLVPSLLRVAFDNQKRAQETIPLFEIAHVYGTHFKDRQRLHATALFVGKNHPRHWREKQQDIHVFDMKAHMMDVLDIFGISENNIQTLSEKAPSYYHPGRSAALTQGTKVLGYFGQIHPRVAKEFDLDGPLCAFEIMMENLPALKHKKAKPSVAPFQPVERDFAFLVKKDFEAGKLMQILLQKLTRQATFPKHVKLERVGLFDVFEGEVGTPLEGQKSLAVSLRLQPEHATLSEVEIEQIMTTTITLIEKETGGTLRA